MFSTQKTNVIMWHDGFVHQGFGGKHFPIYKVPNQQAIHLAECCNSTISQ